MTALWILQALSDCGIGVDKWGVIPMGKDYPFAEMFGGKPFGEFKPGRYVYVNAAHISDEAFALLTNAADHTIFGIDPEGKEQISILIQIEEDKK